MSNYDRVFRQYAEKSTPEWLRAITAEVTDFLSVFQKNQNGLVHADLDADPILGSRPETPIWRITFLNDKGAELSQLRMMVHDQDKDGRPDFVLSDWYDCEGKLAVDTGKTSRCFRDAVDNHLKTYSRIDYKNKPLIIFVSGIESFDDADPENLAATFIDYADAVRKMPIKHVYQPPVAGSKPQPAGAFGS